MFTGIVTDIGEVLEVSGAGDRRLVISTRFDAQALAIGASIACSGICLTVIERSASSFAVQASAETLARTTLGGWRKGTRVNLERPLRAGDEFGGHMVSGHVDGVARLAESRPENDSVRMTFAAPAQLARFVAPKGSVALDGVSLTVNEVESERFGINLIPHTVAVTSLGALRAGDMVNMEIDMVARYVARLLGKA